MDLFKALLVSLVLVVLSVGLVNRAGEGGGVEDVLNKTYPDPVACAELAEAIRLARDVVHDFVYTPGFNASRWLTVAEHGRDEHKGTSLGELYEYIANLTRAIDSRLYLRSRELWFLVDSQIDVVRAELGCG